jgi:hypothetical protein
MAGSIRKPRVREIPLSEVKDDLSHLLREASVARIERSEIRSGRCRSDCRTRISLRSIRATRFTDSETMHRENELLFHLSPEGRA